jgi:cysteine synthase
MARPCGRWFTNGNLDTNDGDWIAEGIARGQATKNVEGVAVDRALQTLSGGGEGT